MAFCKHCGNELADGAKFCPKCGTKTAAGEAAAQTPAGADKTAPDNTVQPDGQTGGGTDSPPWAQDPNATQVLTDLSENKPPEAEGKKKKTGLLIGICCAAAAAVVLFLVFALPGLLGGGAAPPTEPVGYFVRYDIDRNGVSHGIAFVKDGMVTEVEQPHSEDDFTLISLLNYGREGVLAQNDDGELYYTAPHISPALLAEDIDEYYAGICATGVFTLQDDDSYYYTDYDGYSVELDEYIPVGISPDGSQILTYDGAEDLIYTTLPIGGETEIDVDEYINEITCVFNNGSFIYGYQPDYGEYCYCYVGAAGEEDLYDDLESTTNYAVFNADGTEVLLRTSDSGLFYADQYGNFEVIEREDENTFVLPVVSEGAVIAANLPEGTRSYQCKDASLLPAYYYTSDYDGNDWDVRYYSNGDSTRIVTSEEYAPYINENTVQYVKNGVTYIGTLSGDKLTGEKKIADEEGSLFLKASGNSGYIMGEKNVFYVNNGSSEKVVKTSDVYDLYQSVTGNSAVILDYDGDAGIYRKAEEEDTIKRVDNILPTLRTENGDKFIEDDVLLYIKSDDLYARRSGSETLLLEDAAVLFNEGE